MLAADLGYAFDAGTTCTDDAPNTSLNRPGVTALIGLVARGAAQAVVVHTLARLGRPESEGLEALLRELRRRGVPVYVARTPKGYRYDPATGTLLNDPAAVAAANREDWRPPEFFVIPRETEQDESMAELRALRTATASANGSAQGDPGH